MTNKKFKKAAMALALTACVAATPLAANAETPENAVPVENKELPKQKLLHNRLLKVQTLLP